VVLLGGDPRRLEQRRELVNQLARDVLKQEVHLALRRLDGLEPPGPSGRLAWRRLHGVERSKGRRVDVVHIRILLIRDIVKTDPPRRAARRRRHRSAERRGGSWLGEPTRSGDHEGGSLAGKLSAESAVTRSHQPVRPAGASTADAGGGAECETFVMEISGCVSNGAANDATARAR
jgi:hypothetical protein